MVVGKNNPQALARAVGGSKLPPLPKLRVKNPNETRANPCLSLMSSVLGCWASQGYTTSGCAVVEQQLRACMDSRAKLQPQKNKINQHLSRFYPQIRGPYKRK